MYKGNYFVNDRVWRLSSIFKKIDRNIKQNMKLTAIFRIKNEIRVIEECLTRTSEIVDEIIVLDNGSTDGTQNVYKNFNKISKVIFTKGFNEGRDKIILLEEVKKSNSDWVLWLDGDEIFEKNLTRNRLNSYMLQNRYDRISFRLYHFWLSKKFFRIDGKFFLYTLHPQVRMWRNLKGSFFNNRTIHNGSIDGISGPILNSHYRIKHYGYIDIKKVAEKYNRYINLDKYGDRTYEHINPKSNSFSLPFLESKNYILNSFLIWVYYIFGNVIYFLVRIFLKFKNIIDNVILKLR